MSNLLNPILRRTNNFAEEEYRGLAGSQMRILKSFMDKAGLNIYQRVVKLENGVIITCKKSFDREDMFVSVPDEGTTGINQTTTDELLSLTGIVLHPRSGILSSCVSYIEHIRDMAGSFPRVIQTVGVVGGWEYGKREIKTAYMFPLVDSDNATFLNGYAKKDILQNGVLQSTLFKEKQAFIQPGMYGNLDWNNGATYDKKAKKWSKPYKCLSWKGTPTRHFRVPSNVDIPGISEVETNITAMIEDVPEFTTFGTNLYSGGSIIKKAPMFSWTNLNSGNVSRSLILGAMQNKAGTIFIVTQNDHNRAPETISVFSNGVIKGGDTKSYLDSVNLTKPPPNPLVTVQLTMPITKPGFFIALWSSKFTVNKATGKLDTSKFRVDGWELVCETHYNRNGLPWFGNAAGTVFRCSNGDEISTSVIPAVVGSADGVKPVVAAVAEVPMGGVVPYPLHAVAGKYSETATFVGKDAWGRKVYDIATLAFNIIPPDTKFQFYHEFQAGE